MGRAFFPARARRVFDRIARIARRIADLFPLTPLGLAVLAGGLWSLWELAYPELDLVWLVVGYAGLGMVAVALVAVLIGALWLKLATRTPAHAELPRRALETGLSLPTGFTAPALRLFPLVQIAWSWEEPAGAKVTLARRGWWRYREEVGLSARGKVLAIRRRLVVQDAFGLARLAIRQREPVELTVHPHAGKLASLPLLISRSGGDERPHPMGIEDGDRVELRRYVAGDPARFIHWKVFARARRLMVRVPERALSPSRRTVAYLVPGEDDEASAAAARVAIESGALGGEWSFGTDGASKDAVRADEALDLIVRSAGARALGGTGLQSFLQRSERAGPASAVIFVPPRPGEWMARVVAQVRARAVRTRIVIATDGVAPSIAAPLWRRVLVRSARVEATPASDLERVITALGSTRAELIVVDRKTGRRLGERHRAGLRTLEAA